MIKPVLISVMLMMLAAAPAMAADDWRGKAVELAKQEPKVKDAEFSQDISLWVLVDDDGTDRSGYASYFCLLLNDAGKPKGEFVAVTVWDHASASTNSPKQLGKANCQ